MGCFVRPENDFSAIALSKAVGFDDHMRIGEVVIGVEDVGIFALIISAD